MTWKENRFYRLWKYGNSHDTGNFGIGKCPPQEMMISLVVRRKRWKRKHSSECRSVRTTGMWQHLQIYFVCGSKATVLCRSVRGNQDLLTEEQILVSIAPGKTLVWFDEVLGRNLKVIRTMPEYPHLWSKKA